MSASLPKADIRAHDLHVCLGRRVFVESPKGRRSAGFTVPAEAYSADVSMRLRERGWTPYRLRLEPEQHAWIAVVIDWQWAA